MKDITSKAELAQLLEEPSVVLKFSATWCGPCQQMAPIFNKLDEEFKSIKTGGVDLDASGGIAEQFGVTSVPQFFFIKDGKVVDTLKGANRAGLRAGFERLKNMGTSMPKTGGHTLKKPTVTTKAKGASSVAYKWVTLYFSTLFSFDARKTAAAL